MLCVFPELLFFFSFKYQSGIIARLRCGSLFVLVFFLFSLRTDMAANHIPNLQERYTFWFLFSVTMKIKE